jgi:hypothetical protein
VVLAFMVATAAHAWAIGITQADPLVERGLGFAHVIRPALQPFLAHLDLAAVALSDGLASFFHVARRINRRAGRAANRLPHPRWDE